jgi:hypothetical protein
VEILILEFRGQHPSAKSTLAHNFCPFFTKNIFLQRQIHSPEHYFGRILNFFPGKKFGLIQEKTNYAKK